jgi:hypothetical protein
MGNGGIAAPFLTIQHIGMLSLLASWNEFMGMLMESPLGSSVTRAEYAGDTQST